MADTKKIGVNGASSGTDSALQNDITLALLQNGGVARIQRTFKERLDESGWSQDLRDYVEKIFRSGEAGTYDEAMAKVILQIRTGPPAANGAAAPSPQLDLRIPQTAKDGGADQVRKELEQVLDMKK